MRRAKIFLQLPTSIHGVSSIFRHYFLQALSQCIHHSLFSKTKFSPYANRILLKSNAYQRPSKTSPPQNSLLVQENSFRGWLWFCSNIHSLVIMLSGFQHSRNFNCDWLEFQLCLKKKKCCFSDCIILLLVLNLCFFFFGVSVLGWLCSFSGHSIV